MSADFWAGYVSGAVGIIIGNPLDLIKTRLQAGPKPVHDASPAASSVVVTPRGFRGQFENAGTLVKGTIQRSPDFAVHKEEI
jgi:solute carrier family 25 carnitine/acylcarnitine transporter 20/29